MKKSILLMACTLMVFIALRSDAVEVSAVIQVNQIGNGNPLVGKQKSAEGRCQECHGLDGMSGDERIPNHAGQLAGYLIKQLRNFQSGERKHEIMTIMSEDLSETDIADIAAYFAAQKVMQGNLGRDFPVAMNLFVNGDKSRNLPACASCHGENGKGRVADAIFYPAIGGQRRVYLRSQLVNWKQGDRHNSPNGVMNTIAKALSDDEMDALVNYISGL